MIRLVVESINFIGCVIGGALCLVGCALVLVIIFTGVLAFVCFDAGAELCKAHGPKEVSS